MKRIAAATMVFAALTLAGCTSANDVATAGDANPPVETGQNVYICAGDTSATLLQWNNLHGALSGSYTEARLSGTAPGEKVSSDNASLTGTLSGSSVTLSINVLVFTQPLSGTVKDQTLTLNVPQSDGTLQPATCQAGSLEQWNQLVTLLGGKADSDNTAVLQQQAQASAAAADKQAQQDAQQALAAVQGFSLSTHLNDLADDVTTTDGHLADEKKDAAKGATTDANVACYNLSVTVAYEVQSVIEYDAQSAFAYHLDGFTSAVSKGRQVISTLQSSVAALRSRGLPAPAGVDAAVAAANTSITGAIATANGYVDRINADVDTAYAVANAIATGECASDALGAPPAHIEHITG